MFRDAVIRTYGKDATIRGYADCDILATMSHGDPWEVRLLKWATHKWLTPESHVIFAGGFYGSSPIWLSQVVAHVTTFEADPKLYALLVHNLRTNNITNVTAINGALWDSSGDRVSVHEAPRNYGSGGCKLDTGGTTLTTTLDDLNFTEVTWMDLDVEGAENRVISGALQMLENCHPNLTVEIHGREGVSQQAITDQVEQLGYVIGKDCFFHSPGDWD